MGFCVALIGYLPIMHLPMDLFNSTWSPHCGQKGGKVSASNCFPILTPALPASQYEQYVYDYRNRGFETLVQDKYHIQYLFVQL